MERHAFVAVEPGATGKCVADTWARGPGLASEGVCGATSSTGAWGNLARKPSADERNMSGTHSTARYRRWPKERSR